jgi:hypothetical protein
MNLDSKITATIMTELLLVSEKRDYLASCYVYRLRIGTVAFNFLIHFRGNFFSRDDEEQVENFIKGVVSKRCYY